MGFLPLCRDSFAGSLTLSIWRRRGMGGAAAQLTAVLPAVHSGNGNGGGSAGGRDLVLQACSSSAYSAPGIR